MSGQLGAMSNEHGSKRLKAQSSWLIFIHLICHTHPLCRKRFRPVGLRKVVQSGAEIGLKLEGQEKGRGREEGGGVTFFFFVYACGLCWRPASGYGFQPNRANRRGRQERLAFPFPNRLEAAVCTSMPWEARRIGS